ncbi:MAG: TetR/AcrR family transcriptional regulator [Spirochaetia bacterium]|uniref:TetR/AcrR family transcriptional regulator n=1 Tax=Sphaerochaeta sp. TaxID=1972642 RepID=UPI002AA89067|nr:TetR/AcrR family transcriptional regulator [uncultured Sphaerochaeta sp.]NBK22851.1 TetR/AcrR family transcriptional regulator [Spirochaetia bacterium]
MPKRLSEEERTTIRTRLKEEAELSLSRYGLKGTTVDALVEAARIPKGTFYLFYPSKELLCYEVLMDFHAEVQKRLARQLSEQQGIITENVLVSLLRELFLSVDGSFLAHLIERKELEVLMRKLPPAVVAAHEMEDELSFESLLGHLPFSCTEQQIQVFSATLRAVFLTMLHKDEIGEKHMHEVIELLLSGVVHELWTRGRV